MLFCAFHLSPFGLLIASGWSTQSHIAVSGQLRGTGQKKNQSWNHESEFKSWLLCLLAGSEPCLILAESQFMPGEGLRCKSNVQGNQSLFNRTGGKKKITKVGDKIKTILAAPKIGSIRTHLDEPQTHKYLSGNISLVITLTFPINITSFPYQMVP